MRSPAVACLVLASSLALAGCAARAPNVGTPEETIGGASPFAAFVPEAPAFDFSTIVDPDHGGHEVPMLHTNAFGLHLTGQTGVGSILPPGMRGSITQIDVWNGYAVTPGMENGPAFVITDIRDPAHPKPVSYFPTIADGWTARFSKDGQYLFYGCQVLGAPYAPGGVARGTCRDPNAITGASSAASGVSVFDVRDKAHPRFVDFIEVGGSHNIQAAFIDGYDYVVTAKTAILKFDRATQRLYPVAEVPGTHDATVVKHPVTGDWLLYTGTKELAIYNINDPASPVTVLDAGQWKDGTGWHDQVAFPYLVDGRALLALSGESFSSTSGLPDKVTIADITDPAHPKKLSMWVPPFASQLPWASYTFSVHEMAATPQGQLAVSWYHGGVWVIDLSTKERQEKPVTLAAFQPSKDINVVPSDFAQTPVPMVPFVWSAAWDQRGYLVVPDMHTGVYVVEPSWGLHPAIDSGA